MFLRASLLAAAFAFSGLATAAPIFTPDEYPTVATEAIAQFKIDMPDHVAMFYGITLTRNVQDGVDIGVLAKVYVQMTGSAPTVMSRYNCHKHETGAVECHPA